MENQPSATASEYAESEYPASMAGENTKAGFPPYPPYPPYLKNVAPPSVADAIKAGREIRVQHKNTPKKPARPLPKPAKPRAPKVTDVKLSKRAARAHARCLRRHGAVLTDRLERMAKPQRRKILSLWRERANELPPEVIAHFRTMLDADEPFKPDQAYEYFINIRRTNRKVAALKEAKKLKSLKKDVVALSEDKRFIWARNATVIFARGIQQRLSKPGAYHLSGRMLRLSNIILEDLCDHMRMKIPCRGCCHPKAKFMMEMADKIAVWIDEIISESDDRMLMMDFDEDDDILRGVGEAGDMGFADDFLNMMGDGGLLKGPRPAYFKFKGDMRKAFNILTETMYKKGPEQLLSHGKFNQTYAEGAHELKTTPDLTATEFDTALASQLKNDLSNCVKHNTPDKITQAMKDVIEICGDYLAQHAEFNKDKGPAFRILVKAMKDKGEEQLYQKGNVKRTYKSAATELEKARKLDTSHDDPKLSEELHSKLSELVENQTPDGIKSDMEETLDLTSKYLSQCAVEEAEDEKSGMQSDSMARKGDKSLEQENRHNLTYQDGGHGINTSGGPGRSANDVLKDDARHDGTAKGKDGNISSTHSEASHTLASHFREQHPSEGMLDNNKKMSIDKLSVLAKSDLTDGLDAKALAALDDGRSGTALSSGAGTNVSGSGPGAGTRSMTDIGTSEEETRRSSEAERRKREEENRARRRSEEEARNRTDGSDPEREEAIKILQRQLVSRGAEVFYKQPPTSLTHSQAAEQLASKNPLVVDKSVKESADTSKLANKFERKLNALVDKATPPDMHDTMQDVIIDSARNLAEYFIAKSYKALVQLGLISEMQKRGNEIMVEVDGEAETFFFAAQRLKKAPTLDVQGVCMQMAYYLKKILEEKARCRVMPRKLTAAMNDHIKEAADYLSSQVTRPGN